jgi:hypothetical protein
VGFHNSVISNPEISLKGLGARASSGVWGMQNQDSLNAETACIIAAEAVTRARLLGMLELTRFGGHLETWGYHPRKGSSHAEDESTISARIQG